MILVVFFTFYVMVKSQTRTVEYSNDENGNSKPNYCKKGVCIRCVDFGDYFGCEKCIHHDTRTTDVLKCDDMTIQERESNLIHIFLTINSSETNLKIYIFRNTLKHVFFTI